MPRVHYDTFSLLLQFIEKHVTDALDVVLDDPASSTVDDPSPLQMQAVELLRAIFNDAVA